MSSSRREKGIKMIIPGMEEIPFVQTWTQVLKKRGILTLIWIAGAAIVAGIIVLLFRRNQTWHEKIRKIRKNP